MGINKAIMPKRKLSNYLRTYRKRLGLSQPEMARLFGCRCGKKISRHECFTREPTLRNAFTFAVIFRVPVHELFAGIFQEVRQQTVIQGKALMRRLESAPEKDRAKAKMISALQAIVSENEESHSRNEPN